MITAGHITPDSPMGQFLKEEASKACAIVEVGTGSGLGSTLCLMMGLRRDCYLFSYEGDLQQCAAARANTLALRNQCDGHVDIINAILHRGIMPYFHPEDRDVDRQNWAYEFELSQNANVASAPEHIGLLLLDGGDYTSFFDFGLLWPRSSVVVLDDTNRAKANKNWIPMELMRQSRAWECLRDEPDDRNGWAAFRRRIQ